MLPATNPCVQNNANEDEDKPMECILKVVSAIEMKHQGYLERYID
jgi:hypothetical protein